MTLFPALQIINADDIDCLTLVPASSYYFPHCRPSASLDTTSLNTGRGRWFKTSKEHSKPICRAISISIKIYQPVIYLSISNKTMHTSAICLRLVCALFFIQLAAGNVEKTIFVAPPPSTVPAENTAIDDLGLDRLSPTDPTLRTAFNASFPTTDEPYGSESWFYLEDLNPGQRYEVRICWLATQPTSFTLTTYPLQEIVSDQSLLPALLKFSDARLAAPPSSKTNGASYLQQPKARLHDHHNFFHPSNIKKREEQKNDPLAILDSPQADSILFLRIYAAADYFTTNSTLMNDVPPVVADIILDPFLFNVFPRSLVPTALYTVIIAVVAYFVGGFLANFLTGIVTTSLFGREEETGSNANQALGDSKKKDKKKK